MKKVLILTGVLLAPSLASAQALTGVKIFTSSIGQVVDLLIPIVFAIALLVFFWGLAKYILAAGSEEAKAEGRRIMIGGLIALFIMSTVWGIIAWARTQLNLTTNPGSITVPGVTR